ncbi:MFS-type efflux pump ArsJ specific for 1-arseno-3-phosphoglycerate [hydrothermal vent metagenome]|uniref:MFS-type efflux pump ArsJ specific for 1-arseno-3-phosphoglycerate n=1 Tax=hydrothermal vent metagenome TaxID=652676 RepID=A0A3B0X9J7_9ZZZZ
MLPAVRYYLIISGGYWAFTLTDGAIRMLVVLYFHMRGYSPLEVAMLFLFYEFFGIITNLLGGWIASRTGLNQTMHAGMALQVMALAMLMVPDAWLSVAYVMLAQALSGIAKDLNKMSAKASVKMLLPAQHIDKKKTDGDEERRSESTLFKWVALLTGSKNALKGLGFFLGALLLQVFEFRGALGILAVSLFVVLIASIILLPEKLGKAKNKAKFSEIFSKTAEVNILSAARFFLFGSRDIWFVVALPLYLYSVFEWSSMQVGGFLAIWVIGYGIVQAAVPGLIKGLARHQHHRDGGYAPGGGTAKIWAFILSVIPALIAAGLYSGFYPKAILLGGLIIFAVVFAINSAVHSYLIVAWSGHEKVAMNVGFYYMANAGGRLTGTVLSGWIYQTQGLEGCLWWSSLFVLAAALLSVALPSKKREAAP